ncbi:MAG: FAD:protein FMN transferase [Clostridia bacterium]|nr:FAD:protein FMN transferase [Clostridia bacterium]
MKRILCLLLCAALMLGPIGCSQAKQRYEATWYDVFDTVTILTGYAESEAAFSAVAERVHARLLEYHTLYDIYHDAPGGANLKTVNDAAGGDPVAVDPRITELLSFCLEMEAATDHRVDVTLGAVLSLWHDARTAALDNPETAAPPDPDALAAAAQHTGAALLELDAAAGTVRLTDPEARLDVGAIAKGFAAKKVAETLPDGYLLNLGRNIVAVGAKPGDVPWTIGVQSPDDANGLLALLDAKDVAVVTSGDYQRVFTANGVAYHHIIDPDTLQPGTLWRSVTVLCADSAVADALSTALFLLPQAAGESLLAAYHADALWVAPDGTVTMTAGFSAALHTGK